MYNMKNTDHFLTATTSVNTSLKQTWKLWTTPADMMEWNTPWESWHSPRIEINLAKGGNFFFRMEAKDGSGGFDLRGTYDEVLPYERIGTTGSDGRKSIITFQFDGKETVIHEWFEPDPDTPVEVQKDFCQRVLNNFKKYAERS
jgi:uncharacterized protein YndB with AHSA1/START domain